MSEVYRLNQSPMNFPLRDFENFVAQKILNRGLRYFQKRHITELKKNTMGQYQASIIGNEDSPYTSTVTIHKKHITAYSCSCPYKISICKHVAALLYHLKDLSLGGNSIPCLPLSYTRPEIQEKTSKLLDILRLEDIKEFLGEKCEQIQFTQYLLLLKHEPLNKPLSPEHYARLIRSFLDSLANINGEITFFEREKLDQLVKIVLKWGVRATDKHEILASLYFAGAAIEEINRSEYQIDSSISSRILGVQLALEYLESRSEEPLHKSIRKIFFDYCLQLYDRNHKQFSSLTESILSIAINLIKTNHDIAEITRRITSIHPNDRDFHKAQNLALKLLLKQNIH